MTSPDHSQSLVIDHIFQVVDGETERFSGRLMVRVLDADGTTTRRRAMETAQIRILHPGQWLDERWAAFSYSIAKNANGIVYVDSDTGRLLQVEFVSVSRRMGATNKIETELTDFEIIDYGTTVSRIRSITFKDRPVFPVSMKALPPFQNRPFNARFLTDLEASLAAAQAAAAAGGFDLEILLEQASESFNRTETHGAVLGCAEGGSAAVIFQLSPGDGAQTGPPPRFVRLPQDVTLFSCAPDDENEDEPVDQIFSAEQFRFTTSWKSDDEVIIEKELFDPESEDETPKRIPVYSVTLLGDVERLAGAGTAPAAHDNSAAGEPTTDSAEETTTQSAQPSPTASKEANEPTKRTPRRRSTSKASPDASSAVETRAPEAGPEPTPRAAERKGFLRRILPGGTEQKTPAPDTAQ